MGRSAKKDKPAARKKVPPPAAVQRCLNCGHRLHGEYCSHCGQEHIGTGVPGREMLREFFKDEFHLDFRIARTILPLLFQPGRLPAEYVAGRRIRYSPPLRTYVFISVVMFALIAIQARRSELVRAEGHPAAAEAGPAEDRPGEPSGFKLVLPRDTLHLQLDDSTLTPRQLRDSVLAQIRAAEADSLSESGFEKRVRRGVARVLEDREHFLDVLLERSAQAMFLLMPIFSLMLKLLYIRRKRRYLEHLVFALHGHSHAFLMFALVLAGGLAGWPWLQPWLKWPILSIPVYFLLAMKRFYGQGWGKTLAKYLLLAGGYAFVLLAAGVAVLVVSVAW
jgi:hypothetical protein